MTKKKPTGFFFLSVLLEGRPFDIIGQGDLFGMINMKLKTFVSDKRRRYDFIV